MMKFIKKINIVAVMVIVLIFFCKVTVNAQSPVWSDLLTLYQTDESVNQLIFVQYKKGSQADVLMYKKVNGSFRKVLSCKGYVGKNGIGKKKEGDKKTPTGTYSITGAFGIKKNPGTKLNYTRLNKYLYLCGDKKYYNRLIDIRTCPHKCKGERMIRYKPQYDYGLFLDYNKECVYNKGSAIFMHCTGSNKYTAGCIAVSKTNMKKILKTVECGAKICIYKKQR